MPKPQIIADECLVRVRAVGVCGSDVDGFLGRSKKRVPPLVLGHEFSGEVVETGPGVADLRAGAAVAVYPLIACGGCVYCQTNRHQICPNRRVFGLDFHGALEEFVSIPRRCLFSLPAGMSFLEGALVEPLANALHVMSSCPTVEGATGLVYGAGPIGLFVFLVARHFGAKRIAVVDLNARRLNILARMGADLTVNASLEDPVKRIIDWCPGGVDFAVDAVGRAVCRQNSLLCAAPGATMVWIGLSEDSAEIDARAVVTREIVIRGSYAYGLHDFARAIELLSRKAIPYEAFVSEQTLDRGQTVFEELASGHSSLMKAVFNL